MRRLLIISNLTTVLMWALFVPQKASPELATGAVYAIQAAAQQKACPVKSAATLIGFQLGMTVSDVRKRLEDATMLDAAESSAEKGLMTTSIQGSQLKGSDADGIDNVEFSFVDTRLALMKVTFNGPGEWTNAGDFFTRLSDRVGLSKTIDSTQLTGGGGNEKYRVDCAKFSVAMAYSFGVSPTVTLYDPAVEKIVDDRRDKENTKTIRVGPGGGTTTIPVRRRPPN